MSDDNEPQPSKNPFIRFRNHVDGRIGAGVSVFTGKPTADQTTEPPVQQTTPSDLQHRPDQTQQTGFPETTEATRPCGNRMRHRYGEECGIDMKTASYWNQWARHSPYSPYNLGQLRQPVPNDLPAGVNATHFGFQDAFEDLLAANAGRPLMDLNERAAFKNWILYYFGRHESRDFWVDRLARNGLLLRPLPHDPSVHNGRHFWGRMGEHHDFRPSSMDEWLDEKRKWLDERENARYHTQEDRAEAWKNQLEELNAKLKEEFRKQGRSTDEVFKQLDKDIMFNPAEFLRQMEQGFKDFEKEMGRSSSELASGNAHPRTPEDAKPAAPSDEEVQPQTESDLFSTVRSAAAEAEKSFNNFAKIIIERADKWGREASAAPPATATRQEKSTNGEEVLERNEADGGKTVQTTSAHVDTFGFVHERTDVRRLNAAGEEVGRETHYSVRSRSPTRTSDNAEEAGASTETSQDDKEKIGTSEGYKPTGWFWR